MRRAETVAVADRTPCVPTLQVLTLILHRLDFCVYLDLQLFEFLAPVESCCPVDACMHAACRRQRGIEQGLIVTAAAASELGRDHIPSR